MGVFYPQPRPGRESHLLDESEVMADQHHTALKVIDGICQGIDGLNVQVVGGLVQEQHEGSNEEGSEDRKGDRTTSVYRVLHRRGGPACHLQLWSGLH